MMMMTILMMRIFSHCQVSICDSVTEIGQHWPADTKRITVHFIRLHLTNTVRQTTRQKDFPSPSFDSCHIPRLLPFLSRPWSNKRSQKSPGISTLDEVGQPTTLFHFACGNVIDYVTIIRLVSSVAGGSEPLRSMFPFQTLTDKILRRRYSAKTLSTTYTWARCRRLCFSSQASMSCDVHELIGEDFSCDGYIVCVTGALLGTTASVVSIYTTHKWQRVNLYPTN